MAYPWDNAGQLSRRAKKVFDVSSRDDVDVVMKSFQLNRDAVELGVFTMMFFVPACNRRTA